MSITERHRPRFSLEDMLDSFTQRKYVTVNLNTPPRQ
jgi:hypothetical protein